MVTSPRQILLVALGAIVALSPGALAQVVPIPSRPQIGSSNPVPAEPPIVRPNTTPCTVTLFTNLEFADFNDKPFSYAPPSGCQGPWSKVVFNADFTVTAGRQFDRTAAFYLGGANIYFGTTAEPRAKLSPSWHVERDVTEMKSLFRNPQTGVASLGNFVGVSGGVTYNGIIYSTAQLEFYPASQRYPAIPTPDYVLGLTGNGTGRVNSTTDVVSKTFSLPRNVAVAYLDLIAQSQSSDEFWYLNAPSDVANELATYGNTAFREAEITVDGKPAGVAPIYPWIYTGGIDPYLWEPLPGIETLSFKPYRVDLSPFAGVLSDGNDHTVGVSVFNANNGFSVAATLLLYTDPFRDQVTGGVMEDTLEASPTPTVTEDLQTASDGTVTGTIGVASSRHYKIAGYANTSQGRVETTVAGTISFDNSQVVDVNANTFAVDNQNVTQLTQVHESITRRIGFFDTLVKRDVRYPLALNVAFSQASDGSYVQTTTSEQRKFVDEGLLLAPGYKVTLDSVQERVTAADTLSRSAAGVVTHTNTSSSTNYRGRDLLSPCVHRALTSSDLVLTGAKDNYCE